MDRSLLTLDERVELACEIYPQIAGAPIGVKMNWAVLVGACLEVTPDEYKRIHEAARRIKAAKRTAVGVSG